MFCPAHHFSTCMPMQTLVVTVEPGADDQRHRRARAGNAVIQPEGHMGRQAALVGDGHQSRQPPCACDPNNCKESLSQLLPLGRRSALCMRCQPMCGPNRRLLPRAATAARCCRCNTRRLRIRRAHLLQRRVGSAHSAAAAPPPRPPPGGTQARVRTCSPLKRSWARASSCPPALAGRPQSTHSDRAFLVLSATLQLCKGMTRGECRARAGGRPRRQSGSAWGRSGRRACARRASGPSAQSQMPARNAHLCPHTVLVPGCHASQSPKDKSEEPMLTCTGRVATPHRVGSTQRKGLSAVAHAPSHKHSHEVTARGIVQASIPC